MKNDKRKTKKNRTIANEIEKHINAIAIHRDKLRELSDVLESVDEAHYDLECALDKLSQYL